jgi:hypothetical protein
MLAKEVTNDCQHYWAPVRQRADQLCFLLIRLKHSSYLVQAGKAFEKRQADAVDRVKHPLNDRKHVFLPPDVVSPRAPLGPIAELYTDRGRATLLPGTEIGARLIDASLDWVMPYRNIDGSVEVGRVLDKADMHQQLGLTGRLLEGLLTPSKSRWSKGDSDLLEQAGSKFSC